MTTWPNLLIHLRSRYRLEADQPTWVGLLWQFPGPVFQRQRVALASARDRELVEITCRVAPLARLSAQDALAYNATLATGALALAGDHIILRETMPLATLDLGELDRALEITAHEAARLREVVIGRAAPSECAAAFAHLL